MAKGKNGYLYVTCVIKQNYCDSFEIQLWDKCNNLICSSIAHSNKSAKIIIPSNDEYEICVKHLGKSSPINPICVCRWVSLKTYCNNSQYFMFSIIEETKFINSYFSLCDAHYDALPIHRGNIMFELK